MVILEYGVSKPKICKISVHRLVYETFVGEVPQGCEIDHINTIRDDNRIENLRCVSHKENCNNPLTRTNHSKAQKGKTPSEETRRKLSESHKCVNTWSKGETRSEFSRKFKEHFGITNYENPKLYNTERMWYHNHNNKCRWEKEA